MSSRVYIALTTIPSRVMHPLFKQHLSHLATTTQLSPSSVVTSIFLTIPRSYRRFSVQESEDTRRVLHELSTQIPSLDIIDVEQDYGPACKYLGPLLHRWEQIVGHICIFVDDDRFYHRHIGHIYQQFFEQNPTVSMATGNQTLYSTRSYQQLLQQLESADKNGIMTTTYLINPTQSMAAFMSCAWKMIPSYHSFIDYTLHILRQIPMSFYHDEGILLNYIKFQNIVVYHINFPFINQIEHEMPDSLVNGNHVIRRDIENQIRLSTNQSRYFHRTLTKLQFFSSPPRHSTTTETLQYHLSSTIIRKE